ncbi:MAG: homoprotocatechuate degradation operon regulator HpaR [Pseudomonadota bacterium]
MKSTDQNRMRPTDRSLPIALLRAREVVMEPIRDMLSRSGLSEQKWRVLRVIEEDGPLQQTEIADRACLLLSSLTRILGALEQDGFLERRVDNTDRRVSVVSITDQGRELIALHQEQSKRIFAEFRAELGNDKMELLLDLLDDVRQINSG